MKKEELKELLHSLDIPVHEGVTNIDNEREYPRVDYWDYIWSDVMGSGEDYAELDTYQISFYSKTPRHPKLLELRQKLRDEGLHPDIYTEYIEKDRIWHSYFALEVTVDE